MVNVYERPAPDFAAGWSSLIRYLIAWLVLAAAIAPGAAGGLELKSGRLSGPDDDAGLPASLRQSAADLSGGGPALLKFSGPITAETRRAAIRAGIRLEGALGNSAHLAFLPPGGLDSARRLPGLAWAAPFHPGLRISPTIASIAPDDLRVSVPLTIQLFSHADVGARVTELIEAGFAVRGRSPGRPAGAGRANRSGKIVLEVEPPRLAALLERTARWPETLWIGRRPSYRLLNDAGAWVCQSGLDGNQATPVHDNGILGEGQVIAVLDTGLDADICFFRDDQLGLPPANVGFGVGSPDPAQRKVLIVNFLADGDTPADPTDWDDNDHGTHVAGSAAGDDPTSPGVRDSGDGMAPAAKLVIQDGGYAVDDCADLPAIGCPAADLYPFFEQAYLQGARIHSNSYGDRENFTPTDIYSEGSEAADTFMWDHPEFLLVFAAGNNGPGSSTVASPATAKNVLAVGASGHGAGAGSLASFSSQGPAHDGRIKPDVVAPGSGVISADSDGDIGTDNCSTRSLSGTSMACPTAAGLAALVRQYYTDGFYPGGTATPGDAFTPSAALLKATLIASASPMPNVTPPPPSDPQGWGHLLLDDALFFPGDLSRLSVVDVSGQFASPTDPAGLHTLQILDGNAPLRVVLVWTDYPSTPAATTNLVNDLNLEVESPSGAVYLGNVFDNGLSVTGGSADDLNNVEAIRIEAPEAGSWTVRVKPAAIPQPSQGYALVMTGRTPVAGVFLERAGLVLDDTVGGNGDAVLDPGEWVDLPLTLGNSGDTAAANVSARVTSLSPEVEAVVTDTPLAGLASGQQGSTQSPHLRIRLATDLFCTEPVSIRLTYLADGFERSETLLLPTGSRQPFLTDDLEGLTGWQHVAADSSSSSGDWTLGDPDGTEFQPEDDTTPDPGSICLFTAPNGGGIGLDDVDSGAAVARSGAYDLSGHPEARLSLFRWFANRDLGEDAGDFFRLEIRENSGSPDVLLEELGTNETAPAWTEVTFRIADFVSPGALVELKVSAADGSAVGNIIEGAIDDLVFWEPACEIHDPAPNAVDTLTLSHDGTDVNLLWFRPTADPAHGDPTGYRLYRSESPSAGFAVLDQSSDGSEQVSLDDSGAVSGPSLLFYEVIAANASGDSEPLPPD